MGQSPSSAEPAERLGSRHAQRSRSWVGFGVLAAVLATLGALAAVFAATSVAEANADRAQKSFEQSATEMASTLDLAIQHQNDLVVNAAAYMATNPDSGQAQFTEWADSARVLSRYPELQAMGVMVIVPHSELETFADELKADPSGAALNPDGSFSVVPPGQRPLYCFARLGLARPGAVTAGPAGLDLCAGANGAALLETRDTGAGFYRPYQLPEMRVLAIQTPFYAGGTRPTSAAERREKFLGWVGTLVQPSVVLDQALRDQTDTTISLAYDDGSSVTLFSSGQSPAGGQKSTAQLGDGWSVTTTGPKRADGIFEDRNAVTLLATGIVLSALLGLLVFVLGTGRERARKLVDQRTAQLREQADQLRHQALHDALTGLPNRALVMDRIEQLLARTRRGAGTASVLYLDLDDFKNVNDSLGHQAGDELLIALSERLSGSLRDVDTIGRMGGDEFVVLVESDPYTAGPQIVAERLLTTLRQPFHLDGVSMPLMANISIGVASGDRATAGELLRDADIALYQAKALGKNCYATFDPTIQTRIGRRSDLEFELRSALSGDQYRLVYQPIYDLDQLTMVGVESLLRWDKPEGEPVGPDEFIPILEQTGQIREVGRWVLREACAQMALWHSRGDILDVSVNVSARQLDHNSIVSDIKDALESSGLPAQSLIIEITETALMHNTVETARRLQDIKRLGVRIAVDDFGTGYSSLAYLRQFPVDCLKIDRYFTNAVTSSPESRALISTLVQLGKDLGLVTLAEGVETTDEMDLLKRADVDQAQGFLMARPMDPNTLEERLLVPRRPSPATAVSDAHR